MLKFGNSYFFNCISTDLASFFFKIIFFLLSCAFFFYLLVTFKKTYKNFKQKFKNYFWLKLTALYFLLITKPQIVINQGSEQQGDLSLNLAIIGSISLLLITKRVLNKRICHTFMCFNRVLSELRYLTQAFVIRNQIVRIQDTLHLTELYYFVNHLAILVSNTAFLIIDAKMLEFLNLGVSDMQNKVSLGHPLGGGHFFSTLGKTYLIWELDRLLAYFAYRNLKMLNLCPYMNKVYSFFKKFKVSQKCQPTAYLSHGLLLVNFGFCRCCIESKLKKAYTANYIHPIYFKRSKFPEIAEMLPEVSANNTNLTFFQKIINWFKLW